MEGSKEEKSAKRVECIISLQETDKVADMFIAYLEERTIPGLGEKEVQAYVDAFADGNGHIPSLIYPRRSTRETCQVLDSLSKDLHETVRTALGEYVLHMEKKKAETSSSTDSWRALVYPSTREDIVNMLDGVLEDFIKSSPSLRFASPMILTIKTIITWATLFALTVLAFAYVIRCNFPMPISEYRL
ncbi:uncharacterized protein NEMAJ01_2200 [Nematocida major]|uniref:uncharacterized protein n=1 Tax=Nematocida major TaxID=1912982 RepID=UPI0020085E59|nr:uncharacterized protein NEMAJ01_2200 [Nematocida major]KAH9387304.1 hypothetical protein NEMAJ01_2200 [Nematocida major]